MPPFDCRDLSFLVPVRMENPDRNANFQAVLRFFRTFLSGAEIIVAESGPEAHCAHLTGRDGLVHTFLHDEGPFRKPTVLNHGLRSASRSIVVMHDADTFVQPEALEAMAQLFRARSDIVFGIPHNGVCLDLGGPDKERFLEDLDFSMLPLVVKGELHRDYGNSLVCLSPVAVGGVNFYRKEALIELGAFNEQFASYGWDDFELDLRFSKMGHPPCILQDANVIHLHHERGVDSLQHTALAHQNEQLCRRISEMSHAELQRYIGEELRPCWEGAPPASGG